MFGALNKTDLKENDQNRYAGRIDFRSLPKGGRGGEGGCTFLIYANFDFKTITKYM